jgi:hypothetical protein
VVSPSTSTSGSHVAPPPLDPFRGPGGGTSAVASTAATLGAATIAHQALKRDLTTAREALQSAAMRKIVVMNPESHGGTPAARDAAVQKAHSGYFDPYKTSMLTVPRCVEDWERLGARTVKWEMGNCQQIMAAMFYVLKNSPSWSSPIELVRNERHHFLVVGRPDTTASIRDPRTWGNAWRVDLWWQNLSRPDTPAETWPLGMEKCSRDSFMIDNASTLTVDLAWP